MIVVLIIILLVITTAEGIIFQGFILTNPIGIFKGFLVVLNAIAIQM